MKTITIVTGNPSKVRELEAIALGRIKFEMRDIDLTEIQSLDIHEVVEDKLRRAYKILKSPVIVDDVAASLDSLNGLPGPFIKFFNKQLGGESLFKLANSPKDKVTITCIAAYYDGHRKLLGEGLIRGRIVSPRGKNGFGFDVVVIPDGENRTMAEMNETEKMAISHRGQAFRNLLEQLKNLD